MEVFNRLKDDPNYTRKQAKLSDGRVLSYSEAGDLEDGTPVVFCEGLMVSSLVVLTFHQQALHHKLRIIAIDYPGIGDSTPVADRKVEDWPLDVTETCNTILGEATRFHLMCHSMGGPHALAVLSSSLLQERIISATLVSPWLPFEEDAQQHNGNTNKWFLSAARAMPSFVSQTIVPKIVTGAASTSLAMVGSMPSSAPPDLELAKHITDYAAKQGQGGNQQMVQLALRAIVLPTNQLAIPVRIFVGTNDHLVTEASCQLLMDKFVSSGPSPDDTKATLQVVEGADHNSIMSEENLPTILATFASEWQLVK